MSNPYQPPPSRLLSFRGASDVSKAITPANEQSSRFFKLPAEIRNTIYEYTLGGRDLHVHFDKSSSGIKVCPCKASKSEDEIFADFETTGRAADYPTQHRDCKLEPGNRFSLSLLRTCRSIYTEAALIPFESNTFIIQDARRLELFCNGLVPAQQKAIESLEFVSLSPLEPPKSLASFQGQRFTGLGRLRLRVEFPFNTGEREETFEVATEGLKRLSQGQLTGVDVIGYPVRRGATPRIRVWMKEMEKALLISREDRERAKEGNRKRQAEEDAGAQQKRADARSGRGLRSLKEG